MHTPRWPLFVRLSIRFLAVKFRLLLFIVANEAEIAATASSIFKQLIPVGAPLMSVTVPTPAEIVFVISIKAFLGPAWVGSGFKKIDVFA